uniref:RECA_2 domain-containing protein n=1 Tax=Nippostrongylus brasiliensis TaxID=27835 RepID=A0A0N4YZX1_NIPBR
LYSGHPVVDKVLQTDLQYGKVSEIVGDSGVGKTQICYSVVANFLMNTTFSVAWLDSNGSFRASRLMRFLEGDEPSGKGEDKKTNRVPKEKM